MKIVPHSLCFLLTLLISLPIYAEEKRIDDRLDFARGLYSRHMYQMALSEFNSIIQHFPEHSSVSQAFLGKAESLFFLKQYEASLEQFRGFLKDFPKSPLKHKAVKRMGECLDLLDRDAEALQVFSILLDHEDVDTRVAAQYYSGKILFEQKAYPKATEQMLKVIGAKKDGFYTPLAHYYLAEILLAENHFDKAIPYYHKALSSGDKQLKPMATFGLAQAHFKKEDYVGALSLFEAILKTDEVDAQLSEAALINYMQSLYREGRYDDIQTVYTKHKDLIQSKEILMDAKFLVGKALFDAKRLEASQEMFAEILEDPQANASDQDKARLGIVESLIHQKEYQTAVDMLTGLEVLDSHFPDQMIYLKSEALNRLGRYDETLDLYSLFIERFDDSKFYDEILINRAYVLYDLKQFKKAQKAFGLFLKLYPDHALAPKILDDLIIIQIKTKEYNQAIQQSLHMLKQHPKDALTPSALRRLGHLYSEVKSFDKAIRMFERYIENYPKAKDIADVQFDLAVVFQNANQMEKAIYQYNTLLQGDINKELRLKILKNLAYVHVRQDENDKSIDVYEKIIREYPNEDLDPEIFIWMIDFYINQRASEKARWALDTFVERPGAENHEDEIAYYYGQSFFLDEDYERSIEHFSQCIRMEKLFRPESYLGRAKSLMQLERWEDAIQDFQSAIQHAHQNHELALRARYALAENYELKGDYLESAKAFFSIGILYDDGEWVPQALFRAAHAFMKVDDQDTAIQVYRELINRFPDHELSVKANEELNNLNNNE